MYLCHQGTCNKDLRPDFREDDPIDIHYSVTPVLIRSSYVILDVSTLTRFFWIADRHLYDVVFLYIFYR